MKNYFIKFFKNNGILLSFSIGFLMFFTFFYCGYITGGFVSTTEFPELLINKQKEKKISKELVGELKLREFSERHNVTTEMIDYETKVKFRRNESENCKKNKERIILRRSK